MPTPDPSATDPLVKALEEEGYKVAFAYAPTPEDQQRAADNLAAQDMELSLLSGTLSPRRVQTLHPLSL